MSSSAAVFAATIIVAVLIPILATFLIKKVTIGQMLVGGRSFGGVLLYFLSAAEYYTIGTLIAFPAGVYAKGLSYAVWFLGYILLTFPIAYFLAPLWNRAGRRYNAMTVPDLFRSHFGSRPLEVVVFVITFVVGIFGAQYQFTGLKYAVAGSGIHVSTTLVLALACLVALLCVVFAGLRQIAVLSPIKDALMLAAILVLGIAVVLVVPGGTHQVFSSSIAGSAHKPGFFGATIPGAAIAFTVTTILAQGITSSNSLSAQVAFSSKSEAALKRQYIWMPLYMLMYPFLIIAVYFAVTHGPAVKDPNMVTMALAGTLLAGPLVGFVGAAASIAALVALAASALLLGGVISRNVVPDLPENQQRWVARAGIILFFVLAILATLFTSPALAITVLNLLYYAADQLVPGFICIFFIRGIRAEAAGAGMAVGLILALFLYYANVNTYGINLGLISMVVNFLITVGASWIWRKADAPVPVADWGRPERRPDEAAMPAPIPVQP